MIDIVLPWPPSTNTIWRRVGNRTLLSRRGREYRKDVGAAVIAQHQGEALEGPEFRERQRQAMRDGWAKKKQRVLS